MQCLFLGGIESNKYGIQCMFENSILPIKTNIFLWIKETKGELTKNLKLINGLTKLQYHFTVFSFFSFSSIIFSSANKCLLKVATFSAQMEEYGKAIEIYEQVCILTSTWLYTSNVHQKFSLGLINQIVQFEN